ncbi:hypothetical protein [Moraxella ovis]|uniref:hypothetical protein n=1 Tax=Moraxella ovis TaxID=29433 RepID=UPI000D8252F8|nr:hypothetical protein [Moraxella ovis]SPX84701.1 Uncharacterised protein [Moraxella ovis]STZ06548.1 Uncharacterised protein [Moraxella ovis]
MLSDYLNKLSDDLTTSQTVLKQISQASNNSHVSNALDKIASRLEVHAKQLDKIINHMNEKQPHGSKFL